MDTNRTLKPKKYKDNYSISQFKGLYGERENLIVEGYLFSELLETRSSQFNWKIAPHTHPGLYQVFFIDEGTFELHEPSDKRTLTAPCIILIPPTVLHGFNFSDQVKGRILSIADEMLHQIFKDAGFISTMLRTLVCLKDFNLSYPHEKVKACSIRLHEELFTHGEGKAIMLQACIQELFIICYRIWYNRKNTQIERDPVNLGYFEKFQRLIREISAKDTVRDMADKLAITPVHLNRICNLATGRSAGQLINEHLLNEAKKYLRYTSYSVSQIAYLLQFDYPNYFARFFKKHTALTPSQFRKQ